VTRFERLRLTAYSALGCALILGYLAPGRVCAQQFDPSLFAGMRWRMIGAFRGVRAVATESRVKTCPA
jgi:hypothetical protein